MRRTKMATSTKYAYWKWVLLNWHTQKFKDLKDNCVLVHDKQNDKIFVYNIKTMKKEKRYYNQGFDFLLKGYLTNILTIGELEEFYNSLPKKHQSQFWDYLIT